MNYPPDNNDPPQQPNTYPYQPPQAPLPPAKKDHGCLILTSIVALLALLVICGVMHPTSAPGDTQATQDAQATQDTQNSQDTQYAQPTQDVQATIDTQATQDAQATATAQPTFPPQDWSYHGNGNQKTSGFAPLFDTWKLSWTCDPASYGSEYNLIVLLYDINSTLIDTPVNVICKDGVTSGSTLEYNASGLFYLSVISEGPWTIKVQTQ